MPLFSLIVTCEGVGTYTTQCRGKNPYSAIHTFLRTISLNEFLATHTEWPRDFKLKDIYIFIPLDGLTNLYFCGLGQKGKYIGMHLVQTVQRNSSTNKYCGPHRKSVTLR
jgi:hypothetical protein